MRRRWGALQSARPVPPRQGARAAGAKQEDFYPALVWDRAARTLHGVSQPLLQDLTHVKPCRGHCLIGSTGIATFHTFYS